MRPTRVLGYARVSSEAQALGSSLDDQQASVRAYAARRGLEVATFYVEAESAVHEKAERREQIRALLATVRKGDLVVCDKIDRWSRDPAFTYNSIREVLARGASFYAVSDQCDPSTNDGDTMLHVRVLVAREEHKRIRERMVGTRQLQRDRGYYSEGLPPYGYRRSLPKGEKGPEKNVLVRDPERAARVERAFALVDAGASLAAAGRELGLGKDRVGRIVRDRVYLGEIKDSRGVWIRGRHEPLVDAETFARVGEALDQRRLGGARPRTSADVETRDWWLRDVAVCAACGARMGAAYAGPLGPRRRHYLRCVRSCGVVYVPVRKLEELAAPLVVARLEELRDELLRAAGEAAPKVVPMGDLGERRAKLQRRRERLLEAYSLDESMSRDDLSAAMAKLDAERTQLEAQAAAATRPHPLSTAKARREALALVGAILGAWEHATGAERRGIVRRLAERAPVSREVCSFVWRSLEDLTRVGGL